MRESPSFRSNIEISFGIPVMRAYTGLNLKWLRITEPEEMQFGNVRPLRENDPSA